MGSGQHFKKIIIDDLTDAYQWVEDADNSSIIISTLGENDPSRSSARIGFIHPWALRPKLKSREDQFDLYDYGKDQEEGCESNYFIMELPHLNLGLQEVILIQYRLACKHNV